MAYLRSAVVLVAFLGCCSDAGREDLQNLVIYVIQPPPELPCNPFTSEQGNDYGLVLQCAVAVSRTFLGKTSAQISLSLYSSLTDSDNRTIIQSIDLVLSEVRQEDYVIYRAAPSLKGVLRGRHEYWCQVLVNGQDSCDTVSLQRSSATVIRTPSCYQHLPQCTQDLPLGLTVSQDALSSSSSTSESCTDSAFLESLSGDDPRNASLMTTSRNTTTQGGAAAAATVSRAAVIVPTLFLSILLVLAIFAFIVLLVVHWRNRQAQKYRMKDTSGVTVKRKPYVYTSNDHLKQLRRVSSLPDLLHTGGNSYVDSPIYAASSSPNEMHAGKLLDKIRHYYEGSATPDRGSTMESEYLFANPSAREFNRPPSKARESSYMYVTPNPVKGPAQPTAVATTDHLPLPSATRPGVYLSIVGPDGQTTSVIDTIPEEPEDAHDQLYGNSPIYEGVN